MCHSHDSYKLLPPPLPCNSSFSILSDEGRSRWRSGEEITKAFPGVFTRGLTSRYLLARLH